MAGLLLETLFRLVNHFAWIEHVGTYDRGRVRLYVKWGHYPETDGKLDPSIVTDVAVVVGKDRVPAVIGVDKESSRKGALFLEFIADRSGVYTIMLRYVRGVYTLTNEGSWVYGDAERARLLGYTVADTVLLEGTAKAYITIGEEAPLEAAPLGTGLELTPLAASQAVPGARVKIMATLDGKPAANIRVTASCDNQTLEGETDSRGVVEFKLCPGLNVFIAKLTVDVDGDGYRRRRLSSTLTLYAGGGRT